MRKGEGRGYNVPSVFGHRIFVPSTSDEAILYIVVVVTDPNWAQETVFRVNIAADRGQP